MSEIEQKYIDQTIQRNLPPGYTSEYVFTPEDLSYTVEVSFVDLKNVIWGANYSYSESDTLIKYSKSEHSPVSSTPANFLRLATPLYYRELSTGTNSELIGDDLEAAVREELDRGRRGSKEMEHVKRNLIKTLPYSSDDVKLSLTLGRNNFCMYCTSIDPYLSYEREKQMKGLSVDYDFMTIIEKPSEFAGQLGRDVGRHISLHDDLHLDYSQPPINHLLGSFYRQLTGAMGEYLISVYHGPVVYLNEGEISEIVKVDSGVKESSVIPFVKREKYKEQQEYRFIVSVQGHILDKKEFYLKISPELRNLMLGFQM